MRHRCWLRSWLPLTLCTLVATAWVAAACSSRTTDKPEAAKAAKGPRATKATKANKATTTVQDKGRSHKVTTTVGYLEIDPYPSGKAVQGTRVHSKDGRSVLIALRHYEPYLKYANRWVEVKGYPTRSSYDPRVQSYGYFKVLSVKLAPGQQPNPTQKVPHPPRVESQAEVDKLPGRWALVVAKATYEVTPRSVLRSVTLTLADGTKVTKPLHRMSSPERIAELKQEPQATLVARLLRRRGKTTLNASQFCHGVKLRCGMDRRRRKK